MRFRQLESDTPMTLRQKTLLIVGLSLAGVFFVAYLVISYISTSSFSAIENQDTQQNVSRALQALNDEIGKVNTIAGDWAFWDETYQFVMDHNQDYLDSNLGGDAMANLKLSLVLFFDNADQIVYGTAYDLATSQDAPLPDGLEEWLIQNPLLLTHPDTTTTYSGIIVLPQQIILLASMPILNSELEGPIHGTLIMGHYLDDSLIQELSDRTHLSLNFDRLNAVAASADSQQALNALSSASPDATFVQALNDETIAGYSLLNDVYGQPQLLLRVEMPRPVFAQARDSLKYLIVAMLIAGALTVALILFILERLVLSRMARLSQGVATIGASGEMSTRLTLPGSDELSRLAGTINKMLDDLQAGLHREKKLVAKVEALEIQIDMAKREKQVADITETDYFRDLQQKARHLRETEDRENV